MGKNVVVTVNDSNDSPRTNYINGSIDDYMVRRGCIKAQDAIRNIKGKYKI